MALVLLILIVVALALFSGMLLFWFISRYATPALGRPTATWDSIDEQNSIFADPDFEHEQPNNLQGSDSASENNLVSTLSDLISDNSNRSSVASTISNSSFNSNTEGGRASVSSSISHLNSNSDSTPTNALERTSISLANFLGTRSNSEPMDTRFNTLVDELIPAASGYQSVWDRASSAPINGNHTTQINENQTRRRGNTIPGNAFSDTLSSGDRETVSSNESSNFGPLASQARPDRAVAERYLNECRRYTTEQITRVRELVTSCQWVQADNELSAMFDFFNVTATSTMGQSCNAVNTLAATLVHLDALYFLAALRDNPLTACLPVLVNESAKLSGCVIEEIHDGDIDESRSNVDLHHINLSLKHVSNKMEQTALRHLSATAERLFQSVVPLVYSK